MDKRFERQFNKAIKSIDGTINKAVRGAAIELFGAIIKGTPVGQPSLWKSEAPEGYKGGSLRGNWQASIGSPIKQELSIKDSNGTSTLSDAAAAVARYNVEGGAIYFTNNLPYADRIERGYSSQRPYGMVRVNVEIFSGLVDKQARKMKK